MNPQHIALVQSTWKMVEPIAPKAAALFYANLFEANPALKSLFRGDMAQQGEKLMQMIGIAVAKLNDLDVLIPALQALAKRHTKYGVSDADYNTVGGAFLKTLSQGLGSAYTAEVAEAWTAIYTTMATVMIDASKSN